MKLHSGAPADRPTHLPPFCDSAPNRKSIHQNLRFSPESQKPSGTCFRSVLRPPHAFVSILRFGCESQNVSLTFCGSFFETQNRAITILPLFFAPQACFIRFCDSASKSQNPQGIAPATQHRIVKFTKRLFAVRGQIAKCLARNFPIPSRIAKTRSLHFAALPRIGKCIHREFAAPTVPCINLHFTIRS
jgi:hypothetical protein